ncbi:MAG TPA: XdhC family protein [Tepidiformaceae bacterium]|jgi:xanthine/CO dehydrogenase XdhC/CoxF family maturation factor
MQDEIYREIAAALEQGEAVVLATVARTRGSTPRKTGAKMVVRNDGSFLGTIGGGCGEAEVWQEAMTVMQDGKARIVTVDLTEPTDGDDKICGGVMDIFVERLN